MGALRFGLLLAGLVASGWGIRHPGGWHTAADIARIRAQIGSGREPWATAYKALMNYSGVGQLGYEPQPQPVVHRDCCDAHPDNRGNTQFEQDGIQSYYLMLKWIATDDSRYADTAERVIDGWSAVLTGFAGHDQMLAAGIYEFCGRSSNGPPLPKPQTCTSGANGNWDACCMSGVASWAVFLDNATMLQTVLDYYKAGRGSGRLEHYIYESGQCQESGRDQGHTQLGLSKLTETALTLYNALNNTEPFTYANYRLRAGLEYTARYNLGGQVKFEPNGGCPGCESCRKVYPGDWCFKAVSNRSGWTQMWEMAAAIFGKSAPYTQRVVGSQTCQRSLTGSYCDPHPVCQPPAPPGSNSHSVCIDGAKYGNGSESYRPEQLGEGPGLGTLTFYGMPQPPL